MTPIEVLYRDTSESYAKKAGRVVRDQSSGEDICHEAFARAIRFYNSFDESRGTIESWFNRIFWNAVRDHQREVHGRPSCCPLELLPDDVLEGLDLSLSVESMMIKEESFLGGLSDKHQEVIRLFFVKGYSSKQVSQVVSDMTPSNVSTIVNRFVDKVKGYG